MVDADWGVVAEDGKMYRWIIDYPVNLIWHSFRCCRAQKFRVNRFAFCERRNVDCNMYFSTIAMTFLQLSTFTTV